MPATAARERSWRRESFRSVITGDPDRGLKVWNDSILKGVLQRQHSLSPKIGYGEQAE
jgi:hypothetical protein